MKYAPRHAYNYLARELAGFEERAHVLMVLFVAVEIVE
jgi:hypothetical protein